MKIEGFRVCNTNTSKALMLTALSYMDFSCFPTRWVKHAYFSTLYILLRTVSLGRSLPFMCEVDGVGRGGRVKREMTTKRSMVWINYKEPPSSLPQTPEHSGYNPPGFNPYSGGVLQIPGPTE